MIQRHSREAGFTLIEVLLATLIAGMAMVAVSTTFISTLRARNEVENLTESSEAGQRILNLIERDLRGLWHHNIEDNAILRGRNIDIGGYDADRIDFLTTTDAINQVLDSQNQFAYPSLCEVGYWLKDNRNSPGLLELWRREDPLVDDNLITEGTFQLVTDRLESFNIRYYDTLGARAEPRDEWNSSAEDTLPRRITIEFKLHRRMRNRNEVSAAEVEDFEKTVRSYVRHIVLDPRLTEILLPGVAMKPIAPPRPEVEGGGGGGGGGGAEEALAGGGGGGPATIRGPGATQIRGAGGQGGGGRAQGSRGTTLELPRGGGGGFNLQQLLRGGSSGR